MTNKEQIIIDGVDIIDCDYYYAEQETDQVKCDNYSGYCREHKSCPFKQLARKTQECNQLKEDYEELKKRHNEAFQDFESLKQEHEKLEEVLEKFYTLAGEPIEYFLDNYNNLCEDFLLDDRDEDGDTIPILEQIRNRLVDKDILEGENTKLKEKFKKFFGIDNQECWDIAFLNDENARYRKAFEEIQMLVGKIISNDDQPACVYDEECPLNGGVGFDNHCNENCPFVTAKQILDVINKAKGERDE